MAFIVTNLLNFIFPYPIHGCLLFQYIFGLAITSDQNQTGKDAEPPVVLAVMKVLVAKGEDVQG